MILAHFKSFVSESESERESRQSANRSLLDERADVPFSLDCVFCSGYAFHLYGGRGGYSNFSGEQSVYYCTKCHRTFSYRFFLGKRLVEPLGVSVGVGKVPQENPVVGGVSARRERSD